MQLFFPLNSHFLIKYLYRMDRQVVHKIHIFLFISRMKIKRGKRSTSKYTYGSMKGRKIKNCKVKKNVDVASSAKSTQNIFTN